MKQLGEKVGWFRAVHRYFKDPNASVFGKGLVVISIVSAAIYTLSPVDAIPDVIPVLGWLDDIGLIAFATAFTARVVVKYKELPALPHEQSQAGELL